MPDKMTDTSGMDNLLDDLFAEAKTDAAIQPTDDFMARVLADATALQPQAPVVETAETGRSWLQSLFEALGGWQGTGGLVAATMASVWIGFNGADTLTVEGLQAFVSGDTEFYLSDLGGDFSFDFEEG